MTNLSVITLTAPAMLLGLGLVALPVAAHLLHRRARKRVVFPSIDLLVASSAGQSSLLKLRRWLLLLLRCLIIAAIAAAFAQPIWLDARAADAGGNTGAEGVSVVLVVDQSASAGQLSQGVSTIHSLRAIAIRELDKLRPAVDHVNIVYPAPRPQQAFPAMTSNLRAARDELDALKPTTQRGDVGGALALAGGLLADRPGPRRLIILTDMQASQWEDTLEQTSHRKPLPENTRVTIVPSGTPPPTNLALHDPLVGPGTPRVGRPMSLSVNLTNHSDQQEAATIEMQIDGRPGGSQPLTIGPRSQKQVVFSAESNRLGTHRIVFTLPGDGLAIDNRCYLSVNVADRATVLLITDDDTDAPGTGGYFMLRALAPHDDARDPYQVRAVASGQASECDLEDADAVFVGQVGELSNPLLKALHNYIDRGGGVVIFLGGGPVQGNLAHLDALDPGGLLPWMPTEPRDSTTSGNPLTITQGDWRSSLLRRFDQAGQQVIAQTRFFKTWQADTTDRGAHTLLAFSDGTPALTWRAIGAGRLVMANFSPDLSHSDLGKQGWFVALMQGLVEDLQPVRSPHVAAVVGQSVMLTVTTLIDPAGPPPIVTGPEGEPVAETSFTIDENRSTITIHHPTQPGFYTAAQGETFLGTSAINIDPRESDLSRLPKEFLQQALIAPGDETQAHPHAESETGLTPDTSPNGRALWGWLLATALLAMGIELVLLGYPKR